MPFLLRNILWADSLAALSTGLFMLAFARWIAGFHGLPAEWVIAHALVHLSYGSFSGSLAIRRRRSAVLILALIAANAVWATVCFGASVTVARTISPWWMAQLGFEGAFVGALAAIEWSQRNRLTVRS